MQDLSNDPNVNKTSSKTVAAVLVSASPAGSQPDGAAMTKIDGRESAVRAAELFTNREPITQVILCVSPGEADEVKRKLGSHLMFMGLKLVQGEGWYGQLAAAAEKIAADVTHVLVHDAARPAVAYTDLDAIVNSTEPAVALAQPVRGLVAKAAVVPGPGSIEALSVAVVVTPRLYDRSSFAKLIRERTEPSPLALIESSPLNVRVGDVSAGTVKAMIGLLPKPKMKAPTNPFEEAQW